MVTVNRNLRRHLSLCLCVSVCLSVSVSLSLSVSLYLSVCLSSRSGNAYLCELLHVLYTPSRTLRSSDTRMLKIQQYKRKTHGFRTFSCFGPHIWNPLPQDLRHCSTLSSFKAKLKTFLFSHHFHPSLYQYPVSATVIV